jgi:hypothetical protein
MSINPITTIDRLIWRLRQDQAVADTVLACLLGASGALYLSLLVPPVFSLIFAVLTLAGALSVLTQKQRS